ncbi:hypothetical protein F5Y11DRAFT_265880 [Daldinia sp. FL1419]|nr:hypothetical protein F5Y11DRAFT_265880 [Daldinia sp. FL1419]
MWLRYCHIILMLRIYNYVPNIFQVSTLPTRPNASSRTSPYVIAPIAQSGFLCSLFVDTSCRGFFFFFFFLSGFACYVIRKNCPHFVLYGQPVSEFSFELYSYPFLFFNLLDCFIVLIAYKALINAEKPPIVYRIG